MTLAPLPVLRHSRTRGGVSGIELPTYERKFVIDFAGGLLSHLGPEELAKVTPVVAVAGGELVFSTLEKVDGTEIWRLVVDVTAGPDGIVELWLNQWIAVDE